MKAIEFRYLNWQGNEHTYVIVPTGAEVIRESQPEAHIAGRPVLHGDVVTRDGDPREDMGPTRRRTFVLANMKSVKEVEVDE